MALVRQNNFLQKRSKTNCNIYGVLYKDTGAFYIHTEFYYTKSSTYTCENHYSSFVSLFETMELQDLISVMFELKVQSHCFFIKIKSKQDIINFLYENGIDHTKESLSIWSTEKLVHYYNWTNGLIFNTVKREDIYSAIMQKLLETNRLFCPMIYSDGLVENINSV